MGFMSSPSPADSVHLLAAFRQGLDETGFIEGQNVAIGFRWAQGQYDRLSALAVDLASRRVAVLAAVGGGGFGPRSKKSKVDDPNRVCLDRSNTATALGIVAHGSRTPKPRHWHTSRRRRRAISKPGIPIARTGGRFRTGLRQTTSSRSQHRQRWAVESR